MAKNPQTVGLAASRPAGGTATSTAALGTAAGANPEVAAGAAPTAAAQESAAASAAGETVVATKSPSLAAAAAAIGAETGVKVVDVDQGVGSDRRAVASAEIQTRAADTALPLDASERAELLRLRELHAASTVAIGRSGDQRLATAATNIMRDGREYRARDSVPVDAEAYAELRQIGAIVDQRWGDLPDA